MKPNKHRPYEIETSYIRADNQAAMLAGYQAPYLGKRALALIPGGPDAGNDSYYEVYKVHTNRTGENFMGQGAAILHAEERFLALIEKNSEGEQRWQ